jgi:Protein of unknown function (DUF3611)
MISLRHWFWDSAAKPSNTFSLSKSESLAKTFRRLGWIGFWVQIALGSIPITVGVYALILGRNPGAGTRGGFPLIEYLTFAGLLVLAFTTVWSYRYTRLAQQLADPERRPSQFVVRRAAWIGVTASAVGIVFSMLVMLFEVTQLLIHFLRAPQAGIPVIQTTGGVTASWVSAADMMSLMALIFGMFGELSVLTFSLWLLFRTTLASKDLADNQ